MYREPTELYIEMLPTIKQLSHIYKVKGMDVEDLEQEFALVLLKCNENFDATRGATFRTFFASSCKNKVKDMWRRKNHVSYTLNDPVNDGENVERVDLIESDIYQNKREYIDMLRSIPDGYITYRWADGETFQEIADDLKMALSAVYRLHTKTIQKLRDILGIAENAV